MPCSLVMQENLTWGPVAGHHVFPGQAKISFPLQEVVHLKQVSRQFVIQAPFGKPELDITFKWLSIME
jgi:hypothetical protein